MVRHDSDTLTNKDIASYMTSKWTQHYCGQVNLLQHPKVGCHGRGHSHGSFVADGVEGEAVNGRTSAMTVTHSLTKT